MNAVALAHSIREEPCGRDRRASEIEYLFSVSFPLVGNPSDLFGNARKILDKPE
jgi:hypothetical protein